jgi:RHS repeat-associated protein
VSTNATSYLPSAKNSGGTALGTETFLWGLPANGTTTASIAGSVSSADQFTLTVFDASLAGGSVAKTVIGVSTPNAVATGLASAVNGDSNLAALGVTAAAAIPTTSVSVVNISSTSNDATTYTFTKTGSSTIALSKNVGVSQATYNNVNELTAISAGGATRFKGTTDRPVLPTMTVDGGAVTMNSSSNFTANPILSSGSESIAVSATAGGGSGSTTNNYKFEVTGAGSQALTHDNNGNMTSDGAKLFAWDAENRLVKITYPSSNNKTEFTYGPDGSRTKIVETVNGSVTSTKQFIAGEERDGSGNVAKQFFSLGQRNGSSNFLYGPDHLGSIRTMTDNSGVVQASSSFGPDGRPTKLEGTADSDFGFAGMYVHGRSGLNLTPGRPYHPTLGRWISRDPIAEHGGINLYSYCLADPINETDPLGLDCVEDCYWEWAPELMIAGGLATAGGAPLVPKGRAGRVPMGADPNVSRGSSVLNNVLRDKLGPGEPGITYKTPDMRPRGGTFSTVTSRPGTYVARTAGWFGLGFTFLNAGMLARCIQNCHEIRRIIDPPRVPFLDPPIYIPPDPKPPWKPGPNCDPWNRNNQGPGLRNWNTGRVA